MAKAPQFAWHVHHDTLVEELTEPIGVRQAYIRENKDADEVETRLRLLKPVRGTLPVAVVKARAAYLKAGAAYVKADAGCDKADAAYLKAKADAAYLKAIVAFTKAIVACDKAIADAAPAILALHAKECPDCPWDGTTIFPGKED